MESSRNSVSSSVLKLENLAVDSYNNLENISSSRYQGSDSFEKVRPFKNAYGDDPRMISLRLGRQKDYGDSFLNIDSMSSVPVLSAPTKRSRASYQNMQNPCCQVEGCNLDLKSAKDYHRRHRICESHSKSPKVIVAGMERRFCQQCSRFHDLSEFDDKKRSCRRRLSDHNARRRRVPPQSVQFSSLSSALHDQRQHNLTLNGLPISLSNATWEYDNTSVFRQGFIRPSRSGGLDETQCFSSDDTNKSILELHMDLHNLSSIPSSNPRTRCLDQCLHISTTNSLIASDLLKAHSLLSPNSWSLNKGEMTSMDDDDGRLVYGNYNSPVIMRKSNPEPQNLSLFQSFNIPLEQGGPVNISTAHSVNEGTSDPQQYHLSKSPYDSTEFCSRNL